MFIWAAIMLGFLGSMHCIGMCGAIALALPLNRKNKFTLLTGSLFYNLGRITTYAFIGLLFGFIGQGFLLAGFQSVLSLILGIVILISVIISGKWFLSVKWLHYINKPIGKLKHNIAVLFGKKSNQALYFIGMLNGLLPCGFVYFAIIGAISTLHAYNGTLFMAMFGVGTLPAMMLVNILSAWVSIGLRNTIKKITPYVVAGIAVVLILRGMNLGIPYISPKTQIIHIENAYNNNEKIQVMDCCAKPAGCKK